MTARRWLLVTAVAVVAVVVAGGGAVGLVVSNFGSDSVMTDHGAAAPDSGVAPGDGEVRSAEELGAEFLDSWVDDGRVVRRDQGDDTVSEGQAYGMLIAVGIGDERSFDKIWEWTRDNMVRDDGLLAWQWADGAVVDDEPASDADLDTARALVLAGDAFGRPDLTADGDELGTLILDRMTVRTAAGRILLPGEWAAASEPYAYNPSYASPAAFAELGASSGDPRWAELQTGSSTVSTTILAASDLPPDWAQVHADGTVEPMPGPAGGGDDVRYSYDAARFALRYAESCEPSDVALAAQLASTLSRESRLSAALDLGGSALTSDQHPVAYGARAAALAAGGNATRARADLAAAITISDETPTYYGAAWVALSSLMLESDGLGACPAISGGRAS